MKFLRQLIYLAMSVFVGALIVKLAWNGVLPELFKLPAITFWQAFALNLLVHQLLHPASVKVNKGHDFLDAD